ncbi:MAG: transposase zinc-binding domain-containing protein [Armatimonadetes bacterium]|nr:transposase zinc-binding domain-containing protein [Armatimonadota bacterium]
MTLFKCTDCGISLAVPFSCKTRICPTCMTRRAEDLAAGLGDVLPRVPYRHVVITLPRLMGIRHRIRETPRLLRRVTRLAMGVLSRYLARQVGCHRSRRSSRERARPGAVVAWQTHGDALVFHPHLHILITDGVFMPEGDFYGYLDWDGLG